LNVFEITLSRRASSHPNISNISKKDLNQINFTFILATHEREVAHGHTLKFRNIPKENPEEWTSDLHIGDTRELRCALSQFKGAQHINNATSRVEISH